MAKAAKTKTEKTKKPDYGHGDLSWFQHDRFGMFIHWGLYAMPARHEWIKNKELISDEWYQNYFDLFDPDLFDPKAWAKAAKNAGMKYFVITTKHHEGFCLFDSKYTDYKATNTPAKRDLIREVVDAFRAEGLKIGFYYSLLDWHHPQFPVDAFHPLSKHNHISEEEYAKYNAKRDMKKYAKYMRDQVTELLTNYGKIDVLWFDFSYPWENKRGKGRNDWESEKLIKLVRKLQPDIIVDNRLDLPGSADIITPEQYVPANGIRDENGNLVAWEGCQTFSGSWGYHRDETSWKSPEQCIQMLINHVSRGGNLLMNVGPTSRGYLDQRALDRLAVFGEWMKYHSRSIYGCTIAPEGIREPENCRYTYNPETNRLYLHLMAYPFRSVLLPGMAGKIRYAQLLNDGSELHFQDKDGSEGIGNMSEKGSTGDVELFLPVNKPDVTVAVVELILK